MKWNKNWVYGWVIILTIAFIYELIATFLEWRGIMAFPTLSRLIVGTIPLVILEPLTLIVALVLMWHWIIVKWREDKLETGKGQYFAEQIFVVHFPDDRIIQGLNPPYLYSQVDDDSMPVGTLIAEYRLVHCQDIYEVPHG